MQRERTPRLAWIVWGLGVLAYAVAVFNRASLGVAGVEAQHRYGATAAALSLFSVLQLAVYAGLQVPVGVALDRLGSRRLIAAGALTMAAGQALMATSHAIPLAIVARVLVGAGDAMTFICVLRLVAVWFAASQVPVLTQVTGILGQFGQIAAAYPLVALLQGPGWTFSFGLAAVIGVAVSVMAFTTLRDAPPDAPLPPPPATLREAAGHLKHAWREPGTRLGLWTHFVSQFSGVVFALLWGYPFLVTGEHCSPAQAGLLLTVLVGVSMVIGPVLGRLAGRWPLRRSIPILAIVLASAAVWAVVLLWPGAAPFWLLLVLVVVLAGNGPGSAMGFDFARTENEPERIGSAIGIVNVGGFVASLTTILLIGLILNVRAPGGPDAASLADFKVAMSVQYAVWAVGLIGLLVTRRKVRVKRGLHGVLDPFPLAVVRKTRQTRARRVR